MPEGCEAVVMQEQTEQTEEGIRFTADVCHGQNIRRRGEDISAGAVVFPAGTRLTTAELPVIASLGISNMAGALHHKDHLHCITDTRLATLPYITFHYVFSSD